ncbi:hypothetical protein BJ912DRAFT_1005152 [Pholiota molesta]|nr:hypothetical protein BJ912DRAFT_1005152 [Pholiota molesta]
MYTTLSLGLLAINLLPHCTALPDFRLRGASASTLHLPWASKRSTGLDSTGINFNPNGSAFLWLPFDEYSGGTSLSDRWTFFQGSDPTNYVNQSRAIEQGYISVQNGKVFMKADDQTTLPMGQNRESVRIASNATYNTGLFILDLNRAPWGCGNWPANGEIDILEGVHDNEHNQVTWHTNPGCRLDPNSTFTGLIGQTNGANNTNCDATLNSNTGCDVTEWSQASYGPFFEAQGGGILAMKWDENDISVWSFFRAAIPTDVTQGTPNPSLWGPPSAMLKSTQCDIGTFFSNHQIVFDITFCGLYLISKNDMD